MTLTIWSDEPWAPKDNSLKLETQVSTTNPLLKVLGLGLQILIINIVSKYFTEQAFLYNFAGDMTSY